MADQGTEAEVRAAIERLHAAMNSAIEGDPGPIKALYSHRDDVTAFYGWGGYELGWEQVSKRWDWACEQFKGGGPVTYQNVSTVVTAEMAYTTDIEHIRTRVADVNQPTEWKNRVTHIFRREDGEWRLVHRHGQRFEEQFKPSSRLK